MAGREERSRWIKIREKVSKILSSLHTLAFWESWQFSQNSSPSYENIEKCLGKGSPPPAPTVILSTVTFSRDFHIRIVFVIQHLPTSMWDSKYSQNISGTQMPKYGNEGFNFFLRMHDSMHNFKNKGPLLSVAASCLRGCNIVLLAVFLGVPFPSVSAKRLCGQDRELLEFHGND